MLTYFREDLLWRALPVFPRFCPGYFALACSLRLALPGPLCLQLAPGSPRFLLPAACARILLAYLPAARARASPIPLLAILPLAVLLLPTFAKFSDDNFELLGFCSALCRGRSP